MAAIGSRYLEEKLAWCHTCDDNRERTHEASLDTETVTAWRCNECKTVVLEPIKVWVTESQVEFPTRTV